MRSRSWHKWLSRSLPWILVALLVGSGSCRNKPAESTNKKPEVLVSSVAWTFNGPASSRISENEFRQLAEMARDSFRGTGKTTTKIIVVGELHITDGRGTLYLDAQSQNDSPGSIVKTGIAADGVAKDTSSTKKMVTKGLRDLFAAVGELVALTQASPAKWINALQDPEPDVQLLALQLLGQNRIRRAVVPIAQLLGDPREQISEAAAASLGAIGDPAAVPLLIKSIERGNLRSEVRAIEAMGRIGGAEANAYLEMTALGHEVPEVRRLSATLLKRANSL